MQRANRAYTSMINSSRLYANFLLVLSRGFYEIFLIGNKNFKNNY